MVTSPRLKWLALALLAAVQFMVVLDIAIVNVALPSIQTDLGFSQANLQWVISAYALVFGGFLLLGGRTADILGRRRVFMVGWSLHARLAALRARLVRGVADRRPRDPGSRCRDDLAGRARDPDDDLRGGPGAEHRARRLGRGRRLRRRRGRPPRRRAHRRALLGVDLLRQHPGRAGGARARSRCCSARAATPRRRLRRARGGARHGRVEDRVARASPRATTGAGAPRARSASSPLAAALLGGFVLWENRVKEPLMRFGILRTKTVLGANVSGFILGTALFSMFLMLTLYMQQVLGYSAMKTGSPTSRSPGHRSSGRTSPRCS